MPAALEKWSAALPLRALLRDFGSPVYVLAEPQLLANVEAYVRVLGAADRVAYPVKANPAIAVLEILARAGCRADCASPAELRLAQLAGFPGERIVYNSPAADLDTAFRVLERGGTVVADSAAMLQGLDVVLAGHRLPGSACLLVRVNPRAAAGYAEEQDYQHLTAHADPRGKFGVPAEELPALLASVRLEIHGVHAHVGTQMDHVGAFATIARELHAALDSLPRAVANPIVDLGGGLGIPFVDGHCFPSIDDLAPALATVARPGVTYWMEPGHSLVGDAVALLTRVIAKKEVRGKTGVIVDVGTDQLAKVTLLRWHHRLRGPSGDPLPMTGPDAVGGPLCFSGDTLLPETSAAGLEVGDPLLVQHAGAYCFALTNPFNGRAYGGMVLARADGTFVRVDAKQDENQHVAQMTHLWGAESRPFGRPRAVALDRVQRLSSGYLREQLARDGYRYAAVEHVAAQGWVFTVELASDVDFVSMPFALRIAGDATIVATLLALGAQEKTFPVWGVHATLSMDDMISSRRPLVLRVDLSTIAARGRASDKELQARWTVEGARVSGTFDIKFTIPGLTDDDEAPPPSSMAFG